MKTRITIKCGIILKSWSGSARGTAPIPLEDIVGATHRPPSPSPVVRMSSQPFSVLLRNCKSNNIKMFFIVWTCGWCDATEYKCRIHAPFTHARLLGNCDSMVQVYNIAIAIAVYCLQNSSRVFYLFPLLFRPLFSSLLKNFDEIESRFHHFTCAFSTYAISTWRSSSLFHFILK